MTQARHLTQPDMNTLVSLSKRRGFVYPASEIYGGIGSTWDYGPLGVQLQRNIKDIWWKAMVRDRDDIVGLDSAIIQNPEVWQASGHAAGFVDPMVECSVCNRRYRPDQLDDPTKCPDDGGQLSEPRMFNLMFKTYVGPLEETTDQVWLRPETAQGIFINFDNVLTTTRMKLPFGIAQIGKSFRNEITPGNFIFRTREFEQMEMEFFVKPDEGDMWLDYWIKERFQWIVDLGVRPENLRIRPHAKDELSHYAKATSDIEYKFPWGWGELEGIANRTDFDLRQHTESSGRALSYFDQETNTRYFPHAIEPALGVARATLALMLDAYDEEPDKTETRAVFHFHPDVAPVQVAVLPLSRNEKLGPKSREIYDMLRKTFATQFDDAQSIGRRYRRQDEIGTPLCVTVDFQTVEKDNAVTIRDRDSMEQVRIAVSDLTASLRDQLRAKGTTRV